MLSNMDGFVNKQKGVKDIKGVHMFSSNTLGVIKAHLSGMSKQYCGFWH